MLVLEASGEIRVGSSPTWGTKFAQLTQLVECQFDSLDVGSSNLSLRTKFANNKLWQKVKPQVALI